MTQRRREYGFDLNTDEASAGGRARLQWLDGVRDAGLTSVGELAIRRIDSDGLKRVGQYAIEVIGEVDE